ncbi:5' nucleotidase, NT5C type [Hydrogenoanaerobacterium saccharovorans]|uniref:5' nucleotidase, NT5C type n=1 Tax=Hydrogenoanaerobacterium saccharovorans TaxID=474960 RepID=UPI000B812857|nr:DUF3991 domain-containing protein [Hydrogenoanaerobacterium saccharovorans]
MKREFKMPDDSISIAEMEDYGYVYDVSNEMLPLNLEKALELFKYCSIYRLDRDNSEGLMESEEEIREHFEYGGIVGVEMDSYVNIFGIERKRLFVDMDGTLAVFKPTNRLEALYEKDYFANLKPIDSVIGAIKLIIKQHPEVEVNILSSYLSDSPYALQEKNEWLDMYLPETNSDKRRIFLPCGQDKKDYVAGGIKETDYLLDDYTHNLSQWEPPAKGIKLLNGINHTRGTWDKDRIRFDKSSEQLASDIINVMAGVAQVKDDKPELTDGKEQAQMADFMDSTIVEVLKQKGNVMLLQWHYPNNNFEYSVHYLDATLDGVRNGTYFDKDNLDKCQARFDEKTKDITETAEKDFSGFSYPYQKGYVLFNKPINHEVDHAPIKTQPVQEQPPKLERITSFVREILSEPSQTGENKYYGYCNGTRETEGFDTIDELIKNNSRYTRADIAANAPMPDYNILSLYYSDGTVFRIKGDEHNVDFTKMPAKELKEFVDTFQKEQPKSKYKYKSQTAPHQQPKKQFNEQQYEQAKNTNLVAFLQGRGYDLYPSGGWYRWRDHPSLAVNEDGRWAWHSQNLKGGPIDFLVKCENYQFVDAVLKLAGDTNSYVPNLEEIRKEKAEEPKPPMKLPPANSDNKRAIAYLVKTRGLDEKIVKSLIKDKIIYESADYHNVIFVGYDKDGAAKYAAQRGTITNAKMPFKRDVQNSDKSYAFHLRGTSATKIAVFEAPIDAISHKCIQKIFKQDYNSINRIALGGVSDKALERYLQDNPLITDITFGTDNDERGHKAAKELMQKYKDLGYNVSRMTPRGKDFNDDLLNIRTEFAQQSARVQAQPQNEQGAEPDMG